MGQFRLDDHVQALKGKRQGQVGKITGITTDRILVQFEGLQYEMSYAREDVAVTRKASSEFEFRGNCMPLDLHGDNKVKAQQYLVQSGHLCPSWPYSCAGTCDASKQQRNGRTSERKDE